MSGTRQLSVNKF